MLSPHVSKGARLSGGNIGDLEYTWGSFPHVASLLRVPASSQECPTFSWAWPLSLSLSYFCWCLLASLFFINWPFSILLMLFSSSIRGFFIISVCSWPLVASPVFHVSPLSAFSLGPLFSQVKFARVRVPIGLAHSHLGLILWAAGSGPMIEHIVPRSLERVGPV